MPLSTIFQLYRVVSFIDGGKWEYLEKTTDLSQVPEKLYHIMYQVCTDLSQVTDKLYHIMLPRHEQGSNSQL